MGVEFSGQMTNEQGGVAVRLGLTYEHPAFLSFSLANARAVFGLLMLPFDGAYGECTMPEARRAIMQARARFERNAPAHTREGGEEPPRSNRPRVIRGGLDEDGLRERLDRFEAFVDTMARMGADRLVWS